MFWSISSKSVLHIISFIIIFAVHSYSAGSPLTVDDCDLWNDYCDKAIDQDNKYFRCYPEHKVIYLYEPYPKPWDTARQLCSQKFDGSRNADLVQLSPDKKYSAEEMMSKVGDSDDIELLTNGVCCMRKHVEPGVSSVKETCTWILTDEEMSSDYALPTSHSCEIVVVRFSGNHFKKIGPTETGSFEKTSAPSFKYLCAFHIPDTCTIRHPTTPTTQTTSTSEETTASPQTTEPTVHGDSTVSNIQTQPVQPTTKSDVKRTTNPYEDTTLASKPTASPNNLTIDEHLDELEDRLTDPDITSDDLVDCSVTLRDVINTTALETTDHLNKSLLIVEKLQDRFNKIHQDDLKDFSENLVNICSKILDFNKAWDDISRDEVKTNFSSNILRYIQSTGFSYGCKKEVNTSTTFKIRKDNIVIKTFTLDYNTTTEFKVEGIESSVTVPRGLSDRYMNDTCNPGTAVGAIFDKLSRYLKAKVDDNHLINSNIVAFSVDNSLNSTLLDPDVDPVKIVVKHNGLLKFGDKVDCVYWDFHLMDWSSKGCTLRPLNSNRQSSVCECNHLTNFAALMDVSGRQADSKTKDILTKVCSGLSIVCLIVTIGFLTLCRTLRNRRSNITCNLCVCLLVVNLLVVFGMDLTQYNGLCQTVSALLLYSIFASFSWMLMEGYHLYQMIVLVFSNIGHLRLIYLYAIGYGAPLIIAISALGGIGFKSIKEEESYFCWISSPSHPYRVWAVAVPVLLAVLANCLIMFLALREAFSAKLKKKQIIEKDFSSASDATTISAKLSKSFSWMKGFVSLVVLLGVTWISFLLYIHEYGDCFSYIFIILNGLQGVFIFTFQILLNDKARSIARKTYHKRNPSRYLSSLYRTTSTNVFSSTNTKSISRNKSSNDMSSGSQSPRLDSSVQKRANDSNHSSIGSHKSQSIVINRLRNASESILF